MREVEERMKLKAKHVEILLHCMAVLPIAGVVVLYLMGGITP